MPRTNTYFEVQNNIYTMRFDALLLLQIGACSRSTGEVGREITLVGGGETKQSSITNRNAGVEVDQKPTFTVSIAAPKYEPPMATASWTSCLPSSTAP